MKIYGYRRGNDKLLDLTEASVLCTLDEIDKLIEFLEHVKMKHEECVVDSEIVHTHYRDWDERWEKSSSDLIIVTESSN